METITPIKEIIYHVETVRKKMQIDIETSKSFDPYSYEIIFATRKPMIIRKIGFYHLKTL